METDEIIDENCLNCNKKRIDHPQSNCENFLSPTMDAMFQLSEPQRAKLAVAHYLHHNSYKPFDVMVYCRDGRKAILALVTPIDLDLNLRTDGWLAANLPTFPTKWLRNYLIKSENMKL